MSAVVAQRVRRIGSVATLELRYRICGRFFEDSGQHKREAFGETVCRARKACIRGSGSNERLPAVRPHWLGRVNDQILPELQAVPLNYLDRQSLQRVFAVSRSEASRILRQVDTLELSGRLLVGRETLIQWIRTFILGRGGMRDPPRRARRPAV